MKLVLSLLAFACVPAWSQAVKPALQPVRYALTQGQHGTVRVVPLALAGEYDGKLGPLHIRLHLRVTDQGELEGSLDGNGATGIKLARIQTDYRKLSFIVPALTAAWEGSVNPDGSLTGTWHQAGAEDQPLNLSKR
jgi:hypothetical protein